IGSLGYDGFTIGDASSHKAIGHLRLMSSRDFGNSKLFGYREEAKTGYTLDWYYVKKPVTVKGMCENIQQTGYGDETFKQHIYADLNLKPGWNLIKYEITKIYHSQNQETFFQDFSVTSLNEMPKDVKYVYTKNN